MDGDGLPPLRDVIAQHGLSAEKRFGQNFLLDLNLTGRIARAAGDLHGRTVIEVGPGPGGLTRALLAAGAGRVVAIELDPRCLDALAQIQAAYPGRLVVVADDALRQDVVALAGTGPARIVANLPYNVGTALLLQWLPLATRFESFTLMFQREVAERIVAPTGADGYGRLAVAVQWRCAAEILFDVNPRAFTPPPKVVSSVVQITPRPAPLAPADPAALEAVAAAAFGQRRKMLRSALKALGVDVGALLACAGVAGERRAEELDVPAFCALARSLSALRAAPPQN